MYGELIPVGGGDPIPLLKKSLLVGRRESCDVVLRFKNVSAHHCQLTINAGYWYVRDLDSRNGVKVNGVRAKTERRLDPGAVLSVARGKYKVVYNPAELGAIGPPPPDSLETEMFSKSLLERAGLDRGRSQKQKRGKPARDGSTRYDITNDDGNQLRFKHRAL